jgi:hypothetical protein
VNAARKECTVDQLLPVPPHVASSVSGSSTHDSVSHSMEAVTCCKQHPFTYPPSLHSAQLSLAPEVAKRLQGLKTLGHLWRCAGQSWISCNGTDFAGQNVATSTAHVLPESMKSFSESSGDWDRVHPDMQLLEEWHSRAAVQQQLHAAEKSSLADREALAELRKENAALLRACGYGKVLFCCCCCHACSIVCSCQESMLLMFRKSAHCLQKLVSKLKDVTQQMKRLERENSELRSETGNCTVCEKCHDETSIANPESEAQPIDQLQSIQRLLQQVEECGVEERAGASTVQV